jgi:hypothetical protein
MCRQRRDIITRTISERVKLLSLEVGSNTSIIALRVVGATEREPSAWGYNWATLFLGV